MTKESDLIAYVSSGQANSLSSVLLGWMEASSRFTSFVETYRDKIRKKIRSTHDPESLQDLRGELEVAHRLLNDRRLSVVYEPYASAKTRSTDFAVTYRDNLVFNVEVARIRVEEHAPGDMDIQRKEERLVRLLLYKLAQMRPGMANLLVIRTREELAHFLDLIGLMQAVKMRVERKDPGFYAASGYHNPAAFYKDFLRLNGILLWGNQTQVWVNKQARPALADDALRLVTSLLTGE